MFTANDTIATRLQACSGMCRGLTSMLACPCVNLITQGYTIHRNARFTGQASSVTGQLQLPPYPSSASISLSAKHPAGPTEWDRTALDHPTHAIGVANA